MTQAEINNNFWDTFKLIWVGVALLALTALLIAFAYPDFDTIFHKPM